MTQILFDLGLVAVLLALGIGGLWVVCRYVGRLGCERGDVHLPPGTAEGASPPREEHMAFYGTMTRGGDWQAEAGVVEGLSFVERCTIPGRLYDLGEYPGLVAGSDPVEGEVFRVLDPGILEALDRFEGFDPRDPEGSLFVRRRVRLPSVGKECWIYFYNRTPDEAKRIASASWPEHVRRRAEPSRSAPLTPAGDREPAREKKGPARQRER